MTLTRFLLAAACSVASLTAGAQLAASGVSHRLLQEYASADDLRAFALQAKTRPSEGGRFYARYAASVCGRDFSAISRKGNEAISKQISATGTVSSWQLAATEAMPRRCSAFIAGEAAALVHELKSASIANDPLLAAAQDVRAAARSGRPDLVRSAVERAMQLDDPMLWSHERLWDAVAQSDAQAKKKLGFFLGGKVYSESDGLKHLEAYTALELGFCKPNLPCALDDDLGIICAIGGACAPDREAKAKSFYLANGGSDAGWEGVLSLVGKVRAAVANKNVSFFVR